MTAWDHSGNFVVRAIAAEYQARIAFIPRGIKSGKRAGYVITDINLQLFNNKMFAVICANTGIENRVKS